MNQGPTLHRGSEGRDVRRLQRLFVMVKTLDVGDIDGIFGPRTEHAVRDFQRDKGLTVDGIVGPRTCHALPADPDTPQLSRGGSGRIVGDITWWTPAGGAGATLASLSGLVTV
jgi:peptidoglycan hydrolase-like protein with peptidoglycan-binding domain